MRITIEKLKRGFLVSVPNPEPPAAGVWDQICDQYAEIDARAAVHRVANFLGIEPASLYETSYLPPLPAALAELIERGESDDPQVGALKAGEAEQC